MAERVKLTVQARDSRGTREARRLRRQGLIPGVLYGRSEPRAICVPERDLRRAVVGGGGVHSIFDVVVDGDGGKAHPAVLKDFQRDPLRDSVIHVDFQEVRLDQPIHSGVAIHLVGEPAGVREGGVLSQPTTSVTVEALPMEIPPHLELDVSELAIGDSLRVSDLAPVDGVTMLDDPDTVLASVTIPTRVEEPEEVLEEEEEEGVEVPGEERAEGAAEAPAEPEADAAGSPGTTPG